MNCLQFRRAIETAPNAIGALEHEHARECATCANFARRLTTFNRKLDAAVQVPVPPDLREKILLRHSFRTPGARHFHWPALAASLALITSIAITAMGYLHNESELEREVIAMVDAAEYALQARGPVTARTLSAALQPIGLQIDGPIDNVSYVGRCLVRGNLSGHVVLRAQQAAITVFLMPQEHLLRQRRFEGEHWSGRLVPADNGAIAIVAPRGQAVDGVMEQVLRAIRWPA